MCRRPTRHWRNWKRNFWPPQNPPPFSLAQILASRRLPSCRNLTRSIPWRRSGRFLTGSLRARPQLPRALRLQTRSCLIRRPPASQSLALSRLAIPRPPMLRLGPPSPTGPTWALISLTHRHRLMRWLRRPSPRCRPPPKKTLSPCLIRLRFLERSRPRRHPRQRLPLILETMLNCFEIFKIKPQV